MRSTGAIVLSFFAALWAFLALHTAGQPLWMQVMPFAMSFALSLAARNNDRNTLQPSAEERKRRGRTVMIWAAIEGVVIFAGVNLLQNTGHAEWTIALIATVVGLHFFPLAQGMRVPLYWATGLGMLGVVGAAVALVPTGTLLDATIGIGSAAVLYLTAFILTAFAPKGRVAVEA